MAIEVEGPDGTIVEFPDGTTPDIMKSAMAKRFKPPTTTAETVGDVAMQVPSGISRGLVSTLTAPYRALDWAGEKLTGTGFLPDADKMSMYRPYIGDQSPQPQTDAGRYGRAVGESLGYSAAPSAGLLAAAPRMAAMAPTTATRAMGQNIGAQIAARPGAAVAADAVSATGSGLAQQWATEEGFGPGGQTMAAIAGGFAPLAIGQGVAHLTQSARGALARSDPYARVASGLGDSTVDDLSSQVATGATRFDEATNRRTIDVLGQEMVRTGGDRAAATQGAVARMVAEDGITQATAQQRLRNLTSVHRDTDLMFGEYPAVARGDQTTRRMQPQNITDEAAARVDDVGTHWEIDSIANAGSGTSGQRVRNAVTQRAEDLADTTRQVVQRMAPNGNTIQDSEALIQGLTRQAAAEYQQVHSAQGNVNYGMLHGLLRRVVDRHTQRMYGRAGEQFDVLEESLGSLFTTIPRTTAGRARANQPGIEDQVAFARRDVREARRNGLPRDQIIALERQADDLAENMRINRRNLGPENQQILMPSLQELQDMRGGIRGKITAARQAGKTHVVAQLQPLYRDLTRIMERASPQWATANRRWADMNLAEVAQDLGDALSKTAGPRFREQMGEFRRLAPEAQNIVRIHFVQKMLDQIDNAAKLGKMRDLGAQFSTDHMRATVRNVLGDQAAVQMARLIRDHNVAAKSGKMLGGSPTHMRAMRQGDKDQDLGILASIDQASASSFRKWAMDWTINRLREGRNREVGRIVTTPMSDTAAVAENLERMRGAAVRANALSEPVRIPPGTAGKIGGTLSEGDDQDSIIGPAAFEATGIPSVVRGVKDVGKGYSEGDGLRAAAGAGQIALGVMPGAGLFRGGRAAMSAATATAPRTAATLGAAMVPMAGADVRDARASSGDKLRTAVESDPAVQQHRARLEQLRAEQQRILSTPIKGLNRASADAARERMAGPLNEEVATLVGTPDKPGLIKQAEDAAAKGYRENAPFRERYPGTAEALLYGGAALAAGIPFANTLKAGMADRFVHQPAMIRQAETVENALRGSTTQPGAVNRLMGAQPTTLAPNQGVFETERATLQNMLAAQAAREPSHLGQMAAGTAIMQEARMIPEEVDAISFPYGHPTREAATNALMNQSYYASGMVPSLLAGVGAGHVGNTAGRMLTPGQRPDMARAQAAADLQWRGKAPAADVPPSRMERIGEAATQRVESWLQPRSPGSPGAGTPSSPGGVPPAAGTGTGQNRLLPSEPTSSGLPVPSRGQSASPQSPKYGDAHTTIATPLMEGYLAKGQIPPTAQIRDELIAAYKQAGVAAPRPADLTKRINASRPMLEAVKDAPPDVKARVLKALSENPGFLAVPAAAGLGVNSLMQD